MLTKNNFSKKVFTLITGTVFSQLITIASTPVLTRLYSPSDFGNFTIFFSAISVLALFSTGRYELGIVLPESNKDATTIVQLACLLSIVFSISLFFLLVCFSGRVEGEIFQKIHLYRYVIPIAVVIVSFYQIILYYNIRLENYREISFNRLILSTLTVVFQIIFGIFSFGSQGIVIGFILGYLISLFLFLKKSILFSKKSILFSKKSILRMISLSKKYSNFPKYELMQSAVDLFHNHGILFAIGYFYSVKDVGLFSLATRIALLPSSVIGGAIANVFFSSASKNKDHLYSMIGKLIGKMLLLSMFFYIILFATADYIVSFIFGEEWRVSGLLIKSLCFWLFVKFISSPISTVPMIINKQNAFLLFGIAYNILIFAVFIGLVKVNYSFVQSVAIAYTASCVILVWSIIWIILQVKSNEI